MKMKLVLQREDDDSPDEMNRLLNADEAFGLLWDISQDVCRRNLRYNEELSEESAKILEDLQERIYDSGLLKHYN